MRRLAAAIAIVVFIGAGCPSQPSTELVVGAGDTLTLRETVLGVGGKIAELFGAGTVMQTVVLGDRNAMADAAFAWKKDSDGSMAVDPSASTFVLSSSQYDGLANDGGTTLSLGLIDMTMASALGWTDSVKSFLASINQPIPDFPTPSDVLMITVSEANASTWVRVDGMLQKVDAIKASNWFADYLILKNADSPLILSVTLKPTADASLGSNAFRGFEVSEIKTTSP